MDFPDPDGPVIATHSDGATTRLVPSSKRTAPPEYTLVTFSTSTAIDTRCLLLPAQRGEGAEMPGPQRRVDGGQDADRPGRVQRAPEVRRLELGVEDPPDRRERLEDSAATNESDTR